MAADTKVDVYLPLYVRDFLTSTIGWTAEERGHYLTLLMIQWDRGCLPLETSDLERLSPGVGQCWHVLAEKFPASDDGTRRNAKLEEHRCRCVEIREKRSQAGRSAASGRWSVDASRIANAQQTHSKRMANGCHPTSTSTSTSDTESSAGAEDIQPAAPVVATSDPPKRRKRSQPKDSIGWSVESGWQGITDQHRQAWATAYPACTLDIELVRATEWLIANPTKARKSNWRRFLVSWLTRSQDRGGTIRSAGKTPEDVARKERLERKAREFSDYQPAPYRTPKEVAALASAVKLKEEDL
ncbi:MAG: DUF1376 domain-containing protein [Caulobacteraceae bacterium]|nr:DUF1376 domain-containing protein [Caulobacteraceae bacterium]